MTTLAPLTARERRAVVALLTSVLCSSAAAMAGATALGKQVFDLTGRELDLGWLGLAEFAPAALLVLVTGAVADRFDRRRVVAAGALGESVAALGLALYAGSAGRSVMPIFALAACFGTARAFVAPAIRALPSDIVPAERLSWLVPRFSATWQVALIAGPVLGGFLYAAQPRYAYYAMATLLAAAAAAILAIPASSVAGATRRGIAADTAHAGADTDTEAAMASAVGEAIAEAGERPVATAGPRQHLRDALEGLRFIRRQPIVLGAVSLDLFAVLFGGALALLPAIAETRLGTGAVGLGWLRAAGGIGAGLVTAWLAFRPVQRRVGRVLLVVVAIFGAGTIVLGLTRSYAVAFVALAVLSGADAISVFIRATLVPLATPEDLRGRVLAVENVFIGASNELGAFESGVAAHFLGTSAAVVLGGGATLAIAALWGLAFPALRSVDTFPTSQESLARGDPA